jgi:hypothetical protein
MAIALRVFFLVLMVSTNVALTAQSKSPPRQEIENVAAFARLYSVVRYFYPGDAANELDWNRFAVHRRHKW